MCNFTPLCLSLIMAFLTRCDNLSSFVLNVAHQIYGTVDRRWNHATVKRIEETAHATASAATGTLVGEDFTHRLKVVDYLVVLGEFTLLDIRHHAPLMNFRLERCASIALSSSAPLALSSARRDLNPAIFSANSSAVIGTYSIFTSKYCPAESV